MVRFIQTAVSPVAVLQPLTAPPMLSAQYLPRTLWLPEQNTPVQPTVSPPLKCPQLTMTNGKRQSATMIRGIPQLAQRQQSAAQPAPFPPIHKLAPKNIRGIWKLPITLSLP